MDGGELRSKTRRLLAQRLQQGSDGSGCRIRDQSAKPVAADFDAGTTAAREDRLPGRHGGQSDRRMAIESKNPGLLFSQQRPA